MQCIMKVRIKNIDITRSKKFYCVKAFTLDNLGKDAPIINVSLYTPIDEFKHNIEIGKDYHITAEGGYTLSEYKGKHYINFTSFNYGVMKQLEKKEKKENE